MRRGLLDVLAWVLAVMATSLVRADDVPTKGESEQFPQSARLARDRRADVVLETARAHLRQKDFAAAIVALQELLDGPNGFASGGSTSPSFVVEANRLLRELPPVGREAYERLHGAEANRLWQEALRGGRVEGLREVVARFGATTAGWLALRDLAARHVDRGEWSLARVASEDLSRHPHSSVTQETGWIARWVLAESRSSSHGGAARAWSLRVQKLLEAIPAPAGTPGQHLAEWLAKQSPAPIEKPTMFLDWPQALAAGPSGQKVQQVAAELDGEPASWLQEIQAEWQHYDIPVLPSAQPLVIGDIVIARFAHPAKVVAVDALRGKLLWEQSLSGSLGSTAGDLQRHPGIRTPLMEELQRRWFGDSVRGRMTSDGRRVFLVRDLDDLDLKPGAGSRLRNHLEAWDLATGERRWRIGSSVNEPPTGFEGLYFLGPPLVSDGWLYVVAQRELQVALWVLRASDGQLEWTLPLAETDRLQFKEQGWRHVACPVSWASGRLVCPTGAGCVVAVDPITRGLAWSLRFERDDIASATSFLASDRDRPFAARWWESWRTIESREQRVESRESGSSDARLSSLDTRLLIASPESRSLRAVDARSGELLWRTKFAEPLLVAVHESAVLVMEQDRVTRIDPLTGRERWRAEHSAPEGAGDWIGQRYVVPTRGGWSIIDSETGEVRRSAEEFDAARKPSSAGHLTRVGSRWTVLSPTSLRVFESEAKRTTPATVRSRSPWDEAATRLTPARSSGDFGMSLRESLNVLESLGELSDEHVENVLHVRRDRWVQGLIADLLERADAATRTKLDAILDERRRQALDSADAFALQTLGERLSGLPLGRDLRMQLSGRTSSGVGYLKTSLALREIAHGTDRVAAAQAWYRLALLHDFRSEPLDAAECYRELRDRFGDVKLSDGRSSAEWLAEVMPDSLIGRALANGPRDFWPAPLPKITSLEESHTDIYCYPIAVESRDAFWRRTTVSVERQGKKVRFTSAGQRGLWELPLPASSSPFRHDWSTHRGWGLGPLLVVQVGETLFGIQPLDERGETNAKLIWSVSAGPYDETGPHQMLPAQLGVRLDAFRHLDRHEQPVLDVVHASPGLLCYRTRNQLIAIDPASGEKLWSRHRLPPQVAVTSNGEQVVLRMLATREIEVRRGFDGRLLAKRSNNTDPSSIAFEQDDSRIVLQSPSPDQASARMRLSKQNLVTGETVWQREHPVGSIVLRVDESRLGLVEPTNTLRFLSLVDGREQSQHSIEVPRPLTVAHAFADELRLFVILSKPVTETSWLSTQQDRGGYRRPLLNGSLLAFDRQSLKRLWAIPAKNLPLAVDQPKETPFLVLPYKRPSDDSADGQHSDGVLHLIDKRTGQEVLHDVGGLNNVYFALEPDPLQQQIDLLTPKRRLRLSFGGQ